MKIALYRFLATAGSSSTLTHLAHTGKLSAFAAGLNLDEWLLLPHPNSIDIFVVAEKMQSYTNVFAQLQENQIIEKENTQPDEHIITGRQTIECFLQLASGTIVDPLADNTFEKFQENYALANEAGCLGPVIQHLFQQSVWLHEKARMESDFFKYAVHEQSVLRELAQKIFGSLQNGVIYVAGCPHEAENYLFELQNHGCKKIVALHGPDALPEDVFPQIQCSFQQVDGNSIRLSDCDALLVFDTNLSQTFDAKKLSQQLAKRNNRPLLVFDWTNTLAMSARHANLYFYNRSDLAKIIEHNLATRGNSAKTINHWINKEIDSFYTWLASDNRHEFAGIIGSTKSMQHVFELISRIARTNITVLIDGESGTGKELVARAIHRLSARQKQEFVAVNCGAIPENLLESELFGHVRGSFTGAISDKKGLFELAQGGTIFLDEIAELAPHLQVKLLRFLQENEIKRVGSNEMIRLDVRVLAASNKDLSQLVNEGAFRSDLFYRLNVLQLTLPALRERRQDIPLLSNHFLEKFSQKFQKNVSAVSKDAMDALIAYHWPGNIRELENAIEHATALAIGKSLSPYDLPAAVIKKERQNGRTHNYGKMSLRELEKNYILETLDEFEWDYEFVCKQLGIGRTTLWRKLKEYKISK